MGRVRIASTLCTVCLGLALLATGERASAGTFGFVQGHYYTTYESLGRIYEYDEAGQYVGQLNFPDYELSCLTFGPDQSLYVKAYPRDPNQPEAMVLALGPDGTIQQSYAAPRFGGANLVFDGAGHFFVGGTRFELGKPSSGQPFLPYGYQGVAMLPNGNILAIDDYTMYDLSPEGVILSKVGYFGGVQLVNLVGIAYDAEADAIYLSMVGASPGRYNLLKIDGSTRRLMKAATFSSSTDVFVTREGRIVVGNYAKAPQVFDSDLRPVLTIGSLRTEYVTQFIPEPSTVVLAALGAIGLLGFRRRKQRGSSRT